MKLSINYDLMEQIALSEKGYTLSRDVKQIALCTAISSSIIFALKGFTIKPQTLAFLAVFHTFYAYLTNHMLLSVPHQAKASLELLKLSFLLQDINVNTDVELLKKAELYHTQYSLKTEKGKLPYVLEEKYIMVPTVYGDDEQDVSLLQEHKIGSKQYSLSKGAPTKKLKLGRFAYNQ